MHWLAILFILAQLTFPFGTHRNTTLGVPDSFGPEQKTTINDMGVSYSFGDKISFQARIQPGTEIKEILVFITPEGQQTVWQKMKLSAPQNDLVDASADVDVRQMTLYPFSNVSYYFKVVLNDGSATPSETFQFTYKDNRFTWQTLNDNTFEVNWTGTDASLGQEILNDAIAGLQQGQSLLSATPPTPIRIFAYSSSRDLQSALQLTNQPWIAGHATPELGLILISVPSGPEKKLELQRQIPHEIMHILQYQVMGKQYTNQPMWLVEGMASLAELTPNPEYRRVLASTTEANKLLPISSLCKAFPQEASGAFIAYAQSESFVRFLHEKYGTSSLRKLIEGYENGLGCEEGISTTLGTSLRQLEYRWQQESLGMNAGSLALSNLSPYLLLGFIILLIPVIAVLIPTRVRKPA